MDDIEHIAYVRERILGSYAGGHARESITVVCDLAERSIVPKGHLRIDVPNRLVERIQQAADKVDIYTPGWPLHDLAELLPEEPPKHQLNFMETNAGGARVECSCGTLLIAATLHEVIVKAAKHAQL